MRSVSLRQAVPRRSHYHINHNNLHLLDHFPQFQTNQHQKASDTMRFSAVSLLCLAAVAVDAAAVTKRDCVSYRGNSWGCSAPIGFASNWNYCQAVNPNYPVSRNLFLSKHCFFLFFLLFYQLIIITLQFCTQYTDGGLTSARCCNS